MISTHRCEDCGALTEVRTWAATLVDPPDSTFGDGCRHCGGELDPEPVDDPREEADAALYDLDR
jgi:hypothetical protein